MADFLQTSLLWRVLCAIGGWLRRVATGSAIFAAFGRAWRGSHLRAWLIKRLGAEPASVENARSTALLSRANASLSRCHTLKAWLRGSVLYRVYAAILRCGRESKTLGWLFSGGMRGFLLLAIGLYVLIDYVLRDLLAIPVVSSVWDEALLLFCLLWIIWERMDRKTPLGARANPLDLPIAIFFVTGFVLMNVVAPYFSIQIAGFRATAQYLLWFYVITRLLRDDRDFMQLYLTLVVLAAVISLHGIYQYVAGVPMPANWVAQAETAVRTRVYSIFGSPNIMGDFMVLFTPMAVGLAYYAKDTRVKVLAWCCAGLMCVACLFTMSRGAWVAMAVMIVLFILLVDRRLFWLLIVGCAFLLLIPFVRTRIGFLFTDDFIAANTNGGRGGRWALAMEHLYESNPLLGMGLGMFGGAVAMQNKVIDGIQYFYVDNYYLKILVEMGYLGLASFLVMLLGMLYSGCRAMFRTKTQTIGTDGRSTYPLCAGLFSGLVGVLVHCYFENIFEEPYMMVYYWVIAAMIVYLGFLRGKGERSTSCSR